MGLNKDQNRPFLISNSVTAVEAQFGDTEPKRVGSGLRTSEYCEREGYEQVNTVNVKDLNK